MSISRTETLALILLLLVSLVDMVFVFNGLQEPELILEIRRRTYCFRDQLKYVFCISVLMFSPTLFYVLYLGKKNQINTGKKLVISKGKAIILSFLFFLPLITIPASMVVARYSCG